MIIIAPNAYKGLLSSMEACDFFSGILYDHFPEKEIIKYPVSDGGDGFIQCLKYHYDYDIAFIKSRDISGKLRKIPYLIDRENNSVYIELSEVSGIKLIKNLNPQKLMLDSLGELIKNLYDRGFYKINIGLGGSATNDCGLGILSGMGFEFLDKFGNTLKNENVLETLKKIDRIIIKNDYKNLSIKVYCDVNNYLLGEKGCTVNYGPQKGIKRSWMRIWEEAFRNYLRVLCQSFYNKGGFIDRKYFGAAGGAAVSLYYAFDASIEQGNILFLNEKLERIIEKCDFIISGEGRIDKTSFMKKCTGEIIRYAGFYEKPIILITGINELKIIDKKIIILENEKDINSLEEVKKELSNSLKKAIMIMKGKK